MQKAAATYLYARQEYVRDLLFCHVPNGGARTRAEAGIFKSMGVQAGAPDLIVWMRGRTIQIELKPKGRTATGNQEWFGDRLKTLGHSYHVVTAETPAHAVEQLVRLLENECG